MKNFKQLMLAFALVSIAVFTTSCQEKVSMDRVYGTGVYEYNSSSLVGDLNEITNYFSGKGFTGTMTINGSSQDDCDKKAITEFNELIATVSVSEIEALGLSSTTSFSYQLKSPSTSPDEESKVLARYDYPSAN